MTGNDKYRYGGGFMMNSIEVAHIPTISIGLTNPSSEDGYQVINRFNRGSNIYRKVVLKKDVIVGAVFTGHIDRAGIITGLLRDGIKVKGFKRELMSEEFGFISLPKALRKEKLLNLR